MPHVGVALADSYPDLTVPQCSDHHESPVWPDGGEGAPELSQVL